MDSQGTEPDEGSMTLAQLREQRIRMVENLKKRTAQMLARDGATASLPIFDVILA